MPSGSEQQLVFCLVFDRNPCLIGGSQRRIHRGFDREDTVIWEIGRQRNRVHRRWKQVL